MISFISSLEIINVVKPDPNIFLWIAASAADAADVKYILSLSAFPMKGNPVFNDSPKILPKGPPDCPNLCSWVFEKFILADKPFANVLRIFKTCVLVKNSLCGKLVSSLELPIKFN